MPEPDLTVVNLGGGIQSTALCLMAETGRFHRQPDVAYFADTGWEPPYVYETVQAVKERVSYPVEIVSNGRNLADDVYAGVGANGNSFVTIPLFNSNGSMSIRQCTNQYKIDPINKAIRNRLGYKKGERVKKGTAVEQWTGISSDEIWRAKPNRLNYITNRFPLLEANISRSECAAWLKQHHPDIPVGKSSCEGCPFHTDTAWVRIARKRPEAFRRVVEIDHQLRTPGHNEYQNRAGNSYLHRRRIPIDQAVAMAVATPELFEDEDLTAGECDEGHCFL